MRVLAVLATWAALGGASATAVAVPSGWTPMRTSSIVPEWTKASPRGVQIALSNVELLWDEYMKQDLAAVAALYPQSEEQEMEAVSSVVAYYDAAKACLRKNDMQTKMSKVKFTNTIATVAPCVAALSVPAFAPQIATPAPTTTMPPTFPPTTEPPVLPTYAPLTDAPATEPPTPMPTEPVTPAPTEPETPAPTTEPPKAALDIMTEGLTPAPSPTDAPLVTQVQDAPSTTTDTATPSLRDEPETATPTPSTTEENRTDAFQPQVVETQPPTSTPTEPATPAPTETESRAPTNEQPKPAFDVATEEPTPAAPTSDSPFVTQVVQDDVPSVTTEAATQSPHPEPESATPTPSTTEDNHTDIFQPQVIDETPEPTSTTVEPSPAAEAPPSTFPEPTTNEPATPRSKFQREGVGARRDRLQPTRKQLPSFDFMDADQSGAVTAEEWHSLVENLRAVSLDRALKATDNAARALLLEQIEFHYESLQWCINAKLNEMRVDAFDFVLYPQAAARIQRACTVKFRFSLFAGFPPFEFFARTSDSCTPFDIQSWLAKQARATKKAAREEQVHPDRASLDRIRRTLSCSGPSLAEVAGTKLDRVAYYEWLDGVQKCVIG